MNSTLKENIINRLLLAKHEKKHAPSSNQYANEYTLNSGRGIHSRLSPLIPYIIKAKNKVKAYLRCIRLCITLSNRF